MFVFGLCATLFVDLFYPVKDTLHISNHKQEACHTLYNPENIRDELPHANTMIAEQTFALLSRYKVHMLLK